MMHTIAISIVALAVLPMPDAAEQVVAAGQNAEAAAHEEGSGIPAIPTTPAAAGEVLWARAFEVGEPWASDFRSDHPTVQRGFIIVLKADAALAFPRQVACPVLMAGDMPCEVIEPVAGSDFVAVIVPRLEATRAEDLETDSTTTGSTRTDAQAFTSLDLYWATPMLPEQMTAKMGADALQEARAKGVSDMWRAGEPSRATDPLERDLAGAAVPGQRLGVADRAAIVAIAIAARDAVLAR